ncbi:MAG: hypothetical protein ABH827_01470 [bacterium]
MLEDFEEPQEKERGLHRVSEFNGDDESLGDNVSGGESPGDGDSGVENKTTLSFCGLPPLCILPFNPFID